MPTFQLFLKGDDKGKPTYIDILFLSFDDVAMKYSNLGKYGVIFLKFKSFYSWNLIKSIFDVAPFL